MMRSLRWRLMLFLGVAIVVASAVQFAVSFRVAKQEANDLFDYHMEQMALALQDSNSSLQKDEWTETHTGVAGNFDFLIQIWADDDVQIYQSRNFKVIPKQGALGYSNVMLDNGDWRVYGVQNGARVIQVAQRMDVRRQRATSLALHTLWPLASVALLLLLAAWWVVTRALEPLDRIGRDLAHRNADSLAPVSGDDAPQEVSLLVRELNSLLARMASALQAQQRFVADAAHELRSPLTALKLQVHTLARAKGDEARELALGRLRGGVDRAVRLLEQLLAMARQDPLAAEDAPQIVSLCTCVEQVAADIIPLAHLKEIDMQYDGSGEPVSVHADADSLRMLVRNLIDNAVRYAPDKGQVCIQVGVERGRGVLIVQDSGDGIAEENRARVFDRFYRVAGTRASGSGLGLAIVKAVAERYRATIELGRAAIGGLEVRVTFPLATAARDSVSSG